MPFPGTQNLQYVFSGGLNSVVQEYTLDQPNLQAADNTVYNQYGQLDMRGGFTAVATSVLGGGNITNGAALGTFNDELLAMDGQNLYSYDDDNDIWINKGVLFSTINDQIRVINTKIATQANPDGTTLNGLQLYIWEDNRPSPAGAAGIRYSLLDTDTNALIVSDAFIYPLGFRPKVLASQSDNQFYIFYEASDQVLFLNKIATDQPQILQPLDQIISDGFSTRTTGASGTAYDATIVDTYPAVAYSSTTGIRRWLDGGNTLLIPNVYANCIAYAYGPVSTTEWVVYTDTSGGVYAWNSATSQNVRIDTVDAVNISIIEDINSGNLNITYEVETGENPNYIKNVILQWNNVVVPVSTTLKVGLASKPFRVDNNLFVNTIAFTNLQATYFTLCLTQGMTAIAKHSPQNGGNYRNNALLAQCDSIEGYNFLFAGQRKGPFTSYQNAQSVNLGVAGYTIDFDSVNGFNNATSNETLHIVGGIKKVYDGISCVEDNFNMFPELPDGYSCDATLENGQGNLGYSSLTDGYQYQWLATYEWTDNNGLVYRSNPGIAVTLTTTEAGQGALISVPTLTITDKLNARSPVSICIYRTQGNLPIFYKITDDNNPLVNDPTVNNLTFLDTLSDADIAANENLYTGSQLANTAPPGCSLITLYQNRIMINQNEDPNVIWYSQNKFEQDQYNTLPLDWNTSFVEGVDSRGNGITTIGLLGTTLAIFKETSIFLLNGDGPNALDTSGQFNDAQLQVSNVGCINANSLCFITQTPSLPGGLLFKSNQGIYLLGLDNNLYPIGAAVNQYNELTITSANLIPNKNAVIFTTLEGTCLVYNYYFNAWTTWSNLPAIDAVIWQDQIVIMTPSGNVMVQDLTGTVWQDTFANNVQYPIEMKITTPWIKLGGAGNIQGRMAVYNAMILGTLNGACNLQVDVAYDYNPSITESAIIESSMAGNRWGGNPILGSLGTWGTANVFSNYQFQVNLKKTKGHTGGGVQAIQLTLTTLNPQITAGYSLNALSFEVMPLQGSFYVPTSNKIGTR